LDHISIEGDFDNNVFIPLGSPLPNMTIKFLDQYENAVYPVGKCIIRISSDLLYFNEDRASNVVIEV
jgi:hypothetical protein